MKNNILNQKDILLNSRIAQFYDTPEQRQLLSSYNAPSMNPLINYQLQIHHNFSKDDSKLINESEEWSVLSHAYKSGDNYQVHFASETINVFDEKSENSAINDINVRINIIQRRND
ncbi:hypothetical protein M9Y10_046075 [Tritrichomonas musculus]|uniref:Uncharacterized protein n=1 Tax=Tritrichomonas musculus TaxID=1915356 RepID=A0ABR2JX35_9EUKA